MQTLNMNIGCPHCCKEVQVSLIVHHPKDSTCVQDDIFEPNGASENSSEQIIEGANVSQSLNSIDTVVKNEQVIDIDLTPIEVDDENTVIHDDSQENVAEDEAPPLILQNDIVDEEVSDEFNEPPVTFDNNDEELISKGPSLLQRAEPMAFKRTIPQILNSKGNKRGSVKKAYLQSFKYASAAKTLTPLCNIRSGVRSYYSRQNNIKIQQQKTLQQQFSSSDQECSDMDFGDQNIQNYSDEMMNQIYDDSSGLIIDHQTSEGNSCYICHVNFNSWKEVRQHVKNDHFNKKPFVCAECGKALSSKYGLEYHMMTHSKQRNRKIPCELCNQTFYNEICLKTHVRSRHSGVQQTGSEIKKESVT